MMNGSTANDESSKVLMLLQQKLMTAENELLAARARVAVHLKDQIETHHVGPASKRSKLQHSLPLEGTVLNLIVVWLEPEDLGSCVQVCTAWFNDIGPGAWHQVAKNFAPEVVGWMEASRNSSAINYKTVAMGLIRNPGLQQSGEIFTGPGLRQEDVAFVLQVKDKDSKKVVGTICLDLCSLPVSGDENLLDTGRIDMQIPKSDIGAVDPNNLVPDSIFESLLFTIRLLRCDTGESVCFCYERACDNRDYNNSFFWTDSVSVCLETINGVENYKLQLCLGCCLSSLLNTGPERRRHEWYSLTWIGVSAFLHPGDFLNMFPCPRENLVEYLNQLTWK
jgi:hypothetical protein